MLDAAYLKTKHGAALDYETYLATDPGKAEAWHAIYGQAELSDDQRGLIEGFTREMKVLCLSGIWCGDCVQQGPLLVRIAEASPLIDLKWLDRDEHIDLAEQIMINGGLRVPTTIFMAEDFEPVSVFGDRTLARYRAMAARKLGASCPLPGAPADEHELTATLADWLGEVERVQLLLRLSPRLRQKHGD